MLGRSAGLVFWRVYILETIPSALRTTGILLRMMAPVSVAVMVMRRWGLLDSLARALGPVFGFMGLPGAAPLVFITGSLLNIYAAIGVIQAIGLPPRALTIVALMTLTAHNLPVECAIQRRAGSNPWRLLGLRLAAAFLAAVFLDAVLPGNGGCCLHGPVETAGTPPWHKDLASWAAGFARLAGRILFIVLSLMVVQRLLDRAGVLEGLSRLLRYPLRLLGVPPEAAFLWVVANTLGLAYGAGVLIAHVEEGRVSRAAADRLNHHTAVCHSLLEDTCLYAAIGVPVIWITLPRLVLGAVAARLAVHGKPDPSGPRL